MYNRSRLKNSGVKTGMRKRNKKAMKVYVTIQLKKSIEYSWALYYVAVLYRTKECLTERYLLARSSKHDKYAGLN